MENEIILYKTVNCMGAARHGAHEGKITAEYKSLKGEVLIKIYGPMQDPITGD